MGTAWSPHNLLARLQLRGLIDQTTQFGTLSVTPAVLSSPRNVPKLIERLKGQRR